MSLWLPYLHADTLLASGHLLGNKTVPNLFLPEVYILIEEENHKQTSKIHSVLDDRCCGDESSKRVKSVCVGCMCVWGCVSVFSKVFFGVQSRWS